MFLKLLKSLDCDPHVEGDCDGLCVPLLGPNLGKKLWPCGQASVCPKIMNPKPTCFSTTIEHIDHIGVEDQPIDVSTQFSLCSVRSFFLFQDVAVRRHTPGIQIALQFLQSLTAGNLQVAPLPGNIQGTRKVEG